MTYFCQKNKPEQSELCSDVEAPTRFELVNKGFADLCLTSWLWRHKSKDVFLIRLL